MAACRSRARRKRYADKAERDVGSLRIEEVSDKTKSFGLDLGASSMKGMVPHYSPFCLSAVGTDRLCERSGIIQYSASTETIKRARLAAGSAFRAMRHGLPQSANTGPSSLAHMPP